MGANASKEPQAGSVKRTFALDAVQEHSDAINCMALSEDGSVLVTGSDDRSVRMWTTKAARVDCIGIMIGHEGAVTCVVVEEVFAISGSADTTVRKWDMATCACLLVMRGHDDRVHRVLSTGDFIFSTSGDATIRCWDFDSGGCIREFAGHRSGVIPLLFVPDCDDDVVNDVILSSEEPDLDGGDGGMNIRDVLLSGSTDCTARSWSFETGKTLKIFKGHTGPVTCMGTDVDAKVLFTGSTDQTIRSWNIGKGEKLRIFEGHSAAITCMTVRHHVARSEDICMTVKR